MKIALKKMLLAALPLSGLLVVSPTAFAYDDSWEHDAIHEDLGRDHDDFHQYPHSRKEHRRFHKALECEHRALDRSLQDDWDRYGYDRYDSGRPYYEEPYYGDAPYDRYGAGRRPYYGDPYDYSRRSYDDGSSYPGSYGSPNDPLWALWSLLSPR